MTDEGWVALPPTGNWPSDVEPTFPEDMINGHIYLWLPEREEWVDLGKEPFFTRGTNDAGA
jgi:hypothetical protein